MFAPWMMNGGGGGGSASNERKRNQAKVQSSCRIRFASIRFVLLRFRHLAALLGEISLSLGKGSGANRVGGTASSSYLHDVLWGVGGQVEEERGVVGQREHDGAEVDQELEDARVSAAAHHARHVAPLALAAAAADVVLPFEN